MQDIQFATWWVVVVEAGLQVEVGVLWVEYGEVQGYECCVAMVEMCESQYCRFVAMQWAMVVC